MKVLQYVNNLLTVGNKGNNVHCGAARWTREGVDFIEEINEAGPGGAAGRSGRGIIEDGGIGIWLLR